MKRHFRKRKRSCLFGERSFRYVSKLCTEDLYCAESIL